MPKNDDKERLIRCSFCGKSQNQVKRLVAGPGVNICNECIGLCVSIMQEDVEIPPMSVQADPDMIGGLPKPRDQGASGRIRDRARGCQNHPFRCRV